MPGWNVLSFVKMKEKRLAAMEFITGILFQRMALSYVYVAADPENVVKLYTNM